ncbi:glycosyltransferase family 4 protein [Candidatus Roizmanbacteria bacterium]|nr:glycosyltransferase family 4 protein [Candidatus Roizmanbacteria bacterium]
MKKKIIQILCHTLNNDKDLSYYVHGNWCTRAAKSILSNSKEYQCEAWYAIRNSDRVKIFTKNKITFRLFPATTLHPLLESFYGIISSPSLMSAIRKEDPKNCIIHFQGERGSLLHEVLTRYPNYHTVIQYHGYGQPGYLDWLEKLFITPIERRDFPRVAHFFVHIKLRLEYLVRNLGISSFKISYHNVGVDFTKFKPRNKLKARQALKLPANAYIMLYVGTMVKSKGLDTIIKTYKKLKHKYKNLFLLLIGARPFDPLYSQAEKAADQLLKIIDNQLLPLYYNASDVYCFYGNDKTRKYAGIGTAPTEALASNLNTVSTNLIHLPDKIINTVGFIPHNEQDFGQKIEHLIQHPTYKFNARNAIEPYTSLSCLTEKLIATYKKIFSN